MHWGGNGTATSLLGPITLHARFQEESEPLSTRSFLCAQRKQQQQQLTAVIQFSVGWPNNRITPLFGFPRFQEDEPLAAPIRLTVN